MTEAGVKNWLMKVLARTVLGLLCRGLKPDFEEAKTWLFVTSLGKLVETLAGGALCECKVIGGILMPIEKLLVLDCAMSSSAKGLVNGPVNGLFL